MSEIKPCPFCAAAFDRAAEKRGPSVFDEGGRAFVGCVECGARGPMVKSDDHTRDEYVIGRWNSRVVPIVTRQAPPFDFEDEA